MATAPPTQGALFSRPGIREDIAYSTKDVCGVTGVTYRQLDYWTRTGLVGASAIPARGSGNRRRYEFRDVLEVKIVSRLLQAGLSLQKARFALEQLRRLGATEFTQAVLICDGESVYYCEDASQVTDLLTGGQAVFGVSIPHLVGQIVDEMTVLSSSHKER